MPKIKKQRVKKDNVAVIKAKSNVRILELTTTPAPIPPKTLSGRGLPSSTFKMNNGLRGQLEIERQLIRRR